MHYFIRVGLFLSLIVGTISCQEEQYSMMESISADKTGIDFINAIEDSEALSILNYEYIYNGGGVAIGDLNQDGLQDVVFTGNIVDNAIYLNQGDMVFKDVSVQSGITAYPRWSTGITLVDINSDGLLDMYITSSGHQSITDKTNLLLINQGNDAEGTPTFLDRAKAYGISSPSNDTNAAFFDYDNDEDLDLFIISNQMPPDNQPSRYRKKVRDGSSTTVDHLYQNNIDKTTGHPIYIEVSQDAGILIEGFSLGLNICDINEDGWKDIYITNDYLSNDLLYINNQDGTFSDQADTYFKHTSFSAMGNDVVDLDNDGDSDIIVLDMQPQDNYRRKTMLPPNKYSDYINNEKYGFQYQYMRNTLQENHRIPSTTGDRVTFSDVSNLAKLAATDWSWAPVVADFDNDGLKDVIVTNGFPKDITDRDFIDYSTDVRSYASDEHLLPKIPSVQINNYAFKNLGDLQFADVTAEWGIDQPSFSNGAAFGDLDNDGDLDYVVNNINQEASVFQNNSSSGQSVRIKLNGPKANPLGFGAIVHLYYDSIKMQTTDFTLSRGYLSSHEPFVHFGLGESDEVDSIIVDWPSGGRSVINDMDISEVVNIEHQYAQELSQKPIVQAKPLFEEISEIVGLKFIHEEMDFIDYNVQAMLPHKLSQYGPALAVGDANGDGLDDLYISGSHFHKGQFFLQNESGRYSQADLFVNLTEDEYQSEELGALLFDADNDGDNDLYVVHGGYEVAADDPQYQDRIYQNEGGIFRYMSDALPAFLLSGIAVKAADFDLDGDLDLFIGGRVMPHQYPTPVSSYLLRNDSKGKQIKYTNVTEAIAPTLVDVGMITDALWTDYDNDGRVDLMLVGEFMPVTFLRNTVDGFKKHSLGADIESQTGWYNGILASDFDHDGDTDYIIGNVGDNTQVQISQTYPYKVYYKDFDDNGVKDLVPACHFLDQSGEMVEFPYFGRLEIAKQINVIRKAYRKHQDLAVTPMQDLFPADVMDDCMVLSAHLFSSVQLINQGNGKFQMKVLPREVQKSAIYGMLADDVNQDGWLDIILVGNDYGMEISMGRLDAHNGLVGMNDSTGHFNFKESDKSGLFVAEDAKALVKIHNEEESTIDYLASQNRGPLRAHRQNKQSKIITLRPNESYAIITMADGRVRKQEFYYGHGFLSQSSRVIIQSKAMKAIQIYDTKNQLTREM